MFNTALMLLGMICGFVVFDESMDSSHVGYYMLGIGFVVVSLHLAANTTTWPQTPPLGRKRHHLAAHTTTWPHTPPLGRTHHHLAALL